MSAGQVSVSAGPLAARVRAALVIATAALAIWLAPAAAQAASYVAMGDSYASGVGTREYYSSSGSCQRSPHAYPAETAAQLNLPLTFIACSGARTQDVLNNQLGPLSSGTTRVTISIGGNDAGFSSVISACARPWPWTCWGQIDNAQAFIRNTLPGRLNNVYSQMRSRAPNAIIAVVGYPRIFNEKNTCNAASRISTGEQRELNDTADLLASVTRGRALAYGFTYVDPIPSFVGHAVCDSSEWINGLSNPISESYHPNRSGHNQFRALVRPVID